ncbi:ABC transporter ATP-binding protein [Paraburkholderia bannensis]|uniref:ABC transporter ATP-binding protein n=1 Tax=Paraburkholderia bannensis TaxID=765414 RepID=UPI002AB7646F|nr:ABC transporter ATP-binding protein [Paraburkholderia bannensis]
MRFQGLSAISDVSIEVQRHEVVGLIGPNGAGKTTLVNVLTGFQRPTEGTVELGDHRFDGHAPSEFRRKGVARTFQAGRLFRDLSVFENVEVAGLGVGLSRKESEAEARRLLKWVGLDDRAQLQAGALAYTDERRLSIARAMVGSPTYVLLDEPAAGMSDAESEDLSHLILDIPASYDCGVLLIEHNMDVVMKVSHRIHVLSNGATIAEGTPAEIREHQAVLDAYLGGHA